MSLVIVARRDGEVIGLNLTRITIGCLGLGMVLGTLSCKRDDARPSLIENAQNQSDNLLAGPTYEKRDGLHIDAPYLMGKRYDTLDPEVVADQLGTEVRREALEHFGVVEIEFETRSIRLYRDEIFYVEYRLEGPMDMTTAMGVSGFPIRLPPSLPATLEERIVNYWNMRQISLMRVEPNADMFDEIRIWKLRPQEVEATTVGQ